MGATIMGAYEKDGYDTPERDVFNTNGGVPEPAAWAMMLMDFGAMGAMLRQRRSRARAA